MRSCWGEWFQSGSWRSKAGRFRILFFAACVVLAPAAMLPWSPGDGIPDAQGKPYVVDRVASDNVPLTAGAFQTSSTRAPADLRRVAIIHQRQFPSRASISTPQSCLRPAPTSCGQLTSRAASKTSFSHSLLMRPAPLHRWGTNSLDFPVAGSLAGLPAVRNPGSYSSFALELARMAGGWCSAMYSERAG
jgi:hypothetical protein